MYIYILLDAPGLNNFYKFMKHGDWSSSQCWASNLQPLTLAWSNFSPGGNILFKECWPSMLKEAMQMHNWFNCMLPLE